jgi:hypothetical protein
VRAALCFVLAFVVACGRPTTLPPASPPPSAFATPSDAATATTAATATAAATADSPVLRFVLTDVRTGELFALGGLTGKTVIVEGMAVW